MQYEFINDFKLTFSKVLVCFGNNVTHMDLGILYNGDNVNAINDSHISWILKVKSPLFFKDYRPIGLYNVIYELISKIIVNKLKHFLNTMAHDS